MVLRKIFGHKKHERTRGIYTRVYPKVPGLAAWSDNYKWYSSPSLGATVSVFYESA
jgi:hypothetical protein